MLKIVSTAVVAISLLSSIPAHAYDEALAETLCNYIEVDNKSRLRKVLKANKVRIRNIHDSVFCDGQSMLRFAITSEANSVGGFIVSKLPVSALTASAGGGQTLIEWAADFGFSESPVITIAKDKIGS